MISYKTALYRHFDKNDNLLYVGISTNAVTRTLQHRSSSRWAEEIVKITIEYFETRDAALDAETLAISNEYPQYNIQKTPHRVFRNAASMLSDDIKRTTYSTNEAAKLLGIAGGTLLDRVRYNRGECFPINKERPFRFLKTLVDALANKTDN